MISPVPAFVRVSVNVPQVSGEFDYSLPDELLGRVVPGCLVVVPFGEQKVQGIVLELLETPQVEKTKVVHALVDVLPVLTNQQLGLARWLSDYYQCPLPVCLTTMFPPGLSKQADTLFEINPKAAIPDQFPAMQRRLLILLNEKGPLRGRQINRRIPQKQWRRSMRGLIGKGLVFSRPILPEPGLRPKTVRTARLNATPEEVQSQWGSLGRGKAGLRRQKIMKFLMQEAWEVDVAWVYAHAPGANLQDLRRLSERDLIRLSEQEVWRDPLDDIHWALDEAPTLTEEQMAVWQPIYRRFNGEEDSSPIILQGVTGSGKTEIYLRAAEAALAQGKSAIILIPEISLTPQTVRRFAARFQGRVGLVHSRLSTGERYDTWRRARAGELSVIVGARSALFTPMPNLGLIVVDEFDDPSYYQRDAVFSFHAVQAAIEYGRLCNAVTILGSATPDISLRYRGDRRHWKVLRMPSRILAHRETVNAYLRKLGSKEQVSGSTPTMKQGLPPVDIIDMREELKIGNTSTFSYALQNALGEVLEKQQQAILYLNRRGSSTTVFCRECGHVVQCPRCNKPLIAHYGNLVLKCHTCGYERQMPKTCPECGSKRIRQYGAGTEKVESLVYELFPSARVLRYDHETTRQKDTYEIILSHFANHRADILIGTQMLSKGLDLPLVTLVGVVNADVGLNFPDYRANERVFQLLTQVSGRAGRSPLGGRVLLQTYQPDHYVIQHASHHDFEGFYSDELEYRKEMAYPPYTRMIRLETRDLDNNKAEFRASVLAEEIKALLAEGAHSATRMIGPVPCFFQRVNRYYRWQIVLRGPNPAQLLLGRDLKNWMIEIDPLSLL